MKYCMHCMQPVLEEDKECPFCGRKIDKECSVHHLLPGTVLHERFLVGKAIGQGGFGITYIGRDLTLEIPIAIKEYYPGSYVGRNNTVSPVVTCNMVKDEEALFEKGKESFLQEAKILAKFSAEPGIVSVRDFFEENNTAYIVMEYVDGEDLKAYLKHHGKMLPEKTIELMMPIMQALEKIHAQGMVHRDISPDNIRLCENGAKLLDFGAARQVSAAFNKSLSVVLKPGYAPYEQYYTNGRQSSWTDIYSLCATMYYCITGMTPAEAPARLLRDTVKTPTALGIDMDPVMEEALMKGLSVKSEDRFESVSELLFGFQGDGAGSGYEGPTLPNPERPRMEETEIPVADKPIAERIVPEEKQTSESKQKKNPGTGGKFGTVLWKAGAFVVLVAAAILLGFWIRGLGGAEETDASLTTTPIPTESPTPTVELTLTTAPVPTESPTPTIEPTPTPTTEPIPAAEGRNARHGIALTTYDNGGNSYASWSWWIDSELNLFLENISERIRKGRGNVTVFIPYESLEGGIYSIEVELHAGKTRTIGFGSEGSASAEFRMVNGVMSGRNFDSYTDTGEGYLLDISLEYDFERMVEESNIVLKIHSSAADENGRIYINSICFDDEATGYHCVDVTSEELAISMERYVTGEKIMQWEVIPKLEEQDGVEATPGPMAVKEECTTGIAASPYNNNGAAYGGWWSDSELNIRVENIQEQLSQGEFYVTVYIPHNALLDGTYGIEMSIHGGSSYTVGTDGYGCVSEFMIEDGVLQARDAHMYENLSTGYLIRLKAGYRFEELAEGCNMVIKLHSSTPTENGKLYVNNLCFVDEDAGTRYIDFADEELAISTVHLVTGEELETELVPGNFFWIYW